MILDLKSGWFLINRFIIFTPQTNPGELLPNRAHFRFI
jgi:hypothetical protein